VHFAVFIFNYLRVSERKDLSLSRLFTAASELYSIRYFDPTLVFLESGTRTNLVVLENLLNRQFRLQDWKTSPSMISGTPLPLTWQWMVQP